VAEFAYVSSPFYPDLEAWYDEEAAELLRTKREELEEANIYTDLKHGGRALRQYKRRLTGQWELVARGEAYETAFKHRVYAFRLGKSGDGSVYALRMDDYGDPDVHTKKGEPPASRRRVVAVLDGPGPDGENDIVRRLLATYRRHGGRWIERCYERGRFALDPDQTDDPEPGSLCPFCRSDGSCGHLLAYVDVTFGEISGGAFFDHKDSAAFALNEAIEAAWQHLCDRPTGAMQRLFKLLGRRGPLASLVREVFEEKESDEADLCTCSESFIDYLDEVLGGGESVEED